MFIDGKSFYPLTFGAVKSQVARMSYHLQLAHYTNVLKDETGLDFRSLLLFFESKIPYQARFVKIDQEDINFARQALRSIYKRYADCLEKNSWPSYGSEIMTVKIPQYSIDDLSFMISKEFE